MRAALRNARSARFPCPGATTCPASPESWRSAPPGMANRRSGSPKRGSAQCARCRRGRSSAPSATGRSCRTRASRHRAWGLHRDRVSRPVRPERISGADRHQDALRLRRHRGSRQRRRYMEHSTGYSGTRGREASADPRPAPGSGPRRRPARCRRAPSLARVSREGPLPSRTARDRVPAPPVGAFLTESP